jgi:hypothetical protein
MSKLSTIRSSNRFLKRGTVITMSDGWCGSVESDNGETVICIQDGEAPNSWLNGYRGFNKKLMSFDRVGKAFVNWSTSTSVYNRKPDRKHTRGEVAADRGVVVDLDRERLDREWQSAPE